MDDDQNRASFPPPIFKSRVIRARLLAEAAGLKFVWKWNKAKGEFVLSDRKAVKRVRTIWKPYDLRANKARHSLGNGLREKSIRSPDVSTYLRPG